MTTQVRHYEDKEFCKEVNCAQLHQNTITPEHFYCKRSASGGCTKTAKDFHHWLEENGFMLLKLIGEKE